jgi:subtilisin family serine protease
MERYNTKEGGTFHLKKIKKPFLSLTVAASMVISSAPFATVHAIETEAKPSSSYQSIVERLNLKAENPVTSKQQNKEDTNQIFSDDELIIKYNQPISASVHNKLGSTLVKRVSSLGFDVVKVKNKAKLQEVLQAYSANKSVASVSRSTLIRKLDTDIKASDMYHLETLNLSKAWKLAGKNKVKVAVIDTGVDANHPELKNKVTYNYNVQNPLQKGLADTHGTHVAGIIAAEKDNGIGGYGVSPNVDILSIDVFGRAFFGSDYVIAEGILEAIRQKAQVINMSLGGGYPSPIIKEAVQKALDANITVVAAAGNSGGNYMEYPAAFEGVISVGATNDKNKLATFSTYGPSVDIVAPGEDIYNSVYDYVKGSTFAKLSGTSMASPIVAGTAALLLSKNPKLTPYQINYILNESATDLGEKGYDTMYGHGLVDPVAALSFDTKKIPANPKVPEKDYLSKAKSINVLSTIFKSGSLTKLNQVDLYKFEVGQGDYIQTKLTSTENYNYKYDVLFYPAGESKHSQKIEVNDVPENNVEANLFRAPAEGTLVIAIKDATGNYNADGSSSYELTIDRSEQLLEDASLSNEEEAIKVPSLPFNSLGDIGVMYFQNELEEVELPSGEEEATEEGPVAEENAKKEVYYNEYGEEMPPMPGDSDYFTFTAPQSKSGMDQTYKVSLTGVPGIESRINLYMVEKMEYEGETYEYKYMVNSTYSTGVGKGAELAFNGISGNEYVVEVTNKTYFDPYMLMYPEQFGINLERSYSSHIPYSLMIEGTELPPDEDNFPMMMDYPMPEEALAEGDYESYRSIKSELRDIIMDPYMYFYYGGGDYIKQIKESARPFGYDEEATGYIQYMGDEDWFAFTPEKSGLIEFNFANDADHTVPLMEIFTITKDEVTNDEYLSYIGSNGAWDMNGPAMKAKLQLGLKGNKTYLIKLNDWNYNASFKPYTMSAKVSVSDIEDKFEDNDDYENAKTLTVGKSLIGNFATSQDMDIFYFKPTETGLYGYHVDPMTTLPSKYKNLPKELLQGADPVVVVIEDTNGNKKLDPEEEGKYFYTDRGYPNEEERGGIKGVKGKGYFIVLNDYFGSSFYDYRFVLSKATNTDEDKGSVVKNNVPSKPIALKASGKSLVGKGYMDVTSNKGDVDYFKLTVDKDKTVNIKLDLPSDLDGKLTLYDAKGKEIAIVDHYGFGDAEHLVQKLAKGTYFIKVEDAFGNASVSPYTVTVTNK